MIMNEHESLVMRYFQAWYSRDFETMRRCMTSDVRFDMGRAPSFGSAEELIEYCKQLPTFRDVTLLENVVHDERAALLFEGIVAESEVRARAAVFMRIEAGKIRAISVATARLDDGPRAAPTLRNPAPRLAGEQHLH